MARGSQFRSRGKMLPKATSKPTGDKRRQTKKQLAQVQRPLAGATPTGEAVARSGPFEKMKRKLPAGISKGAYEDLSRRYGDRGRTIGRLESMLASEKSARAAFEQAFNHGQISLAEANQLLEIYAKDADALRASLAKTNGNLRSSLNELIAERNERGVQLGKSREEREKLSRETREIAGRYLTDVADYEKQITDLNAKMKTLRDPKEIADLQKTIDEISRQRNSANQKAKKQKRTINGLAKENTALKERIAELEAAAAKQVNISGIAPAVVSGTVPAPPMEMQRTFIRIRTYRTFVNGIEISRFSMPIGIMTYIPTAEPVMMNGVHFTGSENYGCQCFCGAHGYTPEQVVQQFSGKMGMFSEMQQAVMANGQPPKEFVQAVNNFFQQNVDGVLSRYMHPGAERNPQLNEQICGDLIDRTPREIQQLSNLIRMVANQKGIDYDPNITLADFQKFRLLMAAENVMRVRPEVFANL